MLKKINTITLISVFNLCAASGQQTDLLKISALKLSEDSFATFKIIVTNYSDSIAVLPHSIFFDINEIGNKPIGLAVYDSKDNDTYYNLMYGWKDTLIDPQRYPLSVSYILPSQKLEFEIALKPPGHHPILTVNYFFLFDFDYRTFLSRVGNSWQTDFGAKSMNVILEK